MLGVCFCEQVAERAKEIENVDPVIAEIKIKGRASTWTVKAPLNQSCLGDRTAFDKMTLPPVSGPTSWTYNPACKFFFSGG